MSIKTIILSSLKSVNDSFNSPLLASPTDETALFEILDSMGTLDLILELEAALEKEHGRYVEVANEYSMDKEHTPFKTIHSLTLYLESIVNGNA